MVESESNRIVLVLLVGIPACGKSTLAHKLKASNSIDQTHILSLDKIEQELKEQN